MKARAEIFEKLLAIVLPLAAAGSLPLFAAPAAPPAKPEMPQSVFVYPGRPQEGRDPFFPNSIRPYVENPDKITSGPALTDLTFKGIVGGANRNFAIINNHTFAPGDVGDVITKTGQRLTIRCVSINPKANTVTVEANGASVVLTLSQNP
jgi:hypothetical protein